MKPFQYAFASITCALALASFHAFGAPAFPKAIRVLHIENGGVYTTDWAVYPIRVDKINVGTQKPEEMVLGLFEDGKDGGFQGIVQIYCDQPVTSFVATGFSGQQQFNDVSLKDMMKNEVFPRKLVSNIFTLFCRGTSLNAADLNMSRY
ncbi:hypothetical protein [Paraburkholderia tropica]|uniref:hypothetical protein n=1 Tax=Paraburkholderia tropica TaxID=92647 RepID=UPI0007EC62B3|nr:hypothetical protein [Paraburkholderia tropica]OBR46976.1 hypothetical protein A6456_37810 [Paraburkholderia tropica]